MRTARAIAAEAVRRVTDQGAYSTIVLRTALGRSGLDERDRAFAAALVFGTLRRLPWIDRVIEERADRPLARMTPQARAALRIGCYQLLDLSVPDHASVGETVGIVPPRERGFVNAVLRRISAEPASPPTGNGDEEVAMRTGLSPWAVAELRRLVGGDAERAAGALGARAPLCIRANTCRIATDDLRRAVEGAGHRVDVSAIDADCLLVEGGHPPSLPGFRDGWFAVQDHASAFVVRALDPRPGEAVLDVCAAPGGKASFAACLVEPGGRVVAADASPARVGLIRSSAARLGASLGIVVQDGARPAVRGGFDRVLVDTPCSGIGSARRRPELLWRPKRSTLSTLARLQVAIASASADHLNPGGTMVYSVCTFPRAETDAVCDAILRHRPDLEPVEIPGPDGPATRIRLWPHRHGSDGMFVAAFRRRR
jgi:16S rRNA (cytosine967-C5)-methyltransferase